MHTVKQILGFKSSNDIWSVHPDATVYEAIQIMADKRAGALMVMENDSLKGVISERDYAREVILKGKASKSTLVSEIMSADVISVRSSMSVQAAMSVMTEHRIRHLPIVDEGRVAGVVSLGDLVKDVISYQQSTIEHLENYIRS